MLATAGWGLECVGFWLLADAFRPGAISLPLAVYAFALSAVAGAVLILFPRGLGPTEASMSALLTTRYVAAGLGLEAARASATAVICQCTLWFAVAIGAIAAPLFRRLPHPGDANAVLDQRCRATTDISRCAPAGSAATPTAARAG